jgi:hypothetical protein
MPKRALPTRPEAGYHDFLEEMEGVMLGESDRTIGILGRAYADALAEKLLHSFLVNGKVSEGLLHHSGVVGSFSARVDLCYALGLLPEATYSDLRFVREIGNYCAHHIEIGSFESSPLKDWCQWPVRESPESRASVWVTTLALSVGLRWGWDS